MSDLEVSEIKSAIQSVGESFAEFKKTNDQRLAEIESKGVADPLVEGKLQQIEKDLDKFEDINQRMLAQADSQKAANEKLDKLETMLSRPGVSVDQGNAISLEQKAFEKYTRYGADQLDQTEKKALTVANDARAGFLAPVEYVNELIKTITEVTPMRQVARVRQTANKSIQIPSRTATFAALFVGETATRAETTGYTTALEEIPAHEMYAMVDISEALLEDSAFNLESEMREEFTRQFAKREGAATINGTKAGQPEGILQNASIAQVNCGVAAAYTGQTVTNNMITLVHSIKSDYAANARFMFNRTTLADIRRLVDGAGQYIFAPGMTLISGVPNTILGYPYVEAPDMPDVAANSLSTAFGDFGKGYMIVDRINMSILRDPFTIATSGQVRYLARRRMGGQVILPEALVLFKTAV